MRDAPFALAFVNTSASSPAPRRTPPPYRPAAEPSRKRPKGFLARMRCRIERWLCWLMAAASHRLFEVTMKLARSGFLSRAEVGLLFRWANRLNRASIRLLRKGSW
ncbi:hypothetical protein K32_09620 [Kaistia sp. 32K]|uniref:hypothetical protein n=1 Tax=Kaistia sp. 32K TaxID=2795690 RepID=UPI0019157CED|nr:hypothetical protein [Kaistia sp. 32K]BCP52345.1 hypothetical protein K32_09620 [Kaistia sp. 32K]